MEENQTNQNLNQQPVQPVQPQPEQVQQPVQWQAQPAQPVQEPTVSMQIQQLLVQQQQYQQQYNQLVDYVKKTPNLPIEQVNQIKAQLDQLNALFVQGKQQLQALWYTSVQVNKPTNVKKWAKANFSFKKLAIWCVVVLLLIFTGFAVTLFSLESNPDALQWIWIDALNAKLILQAFTWLIFWSILLLMIWLIVWNIYRLITVKNQWKTRYVTWLLGWVFWLILFWTIMWLVFVEIEKIRIEKSVINRPIVQPYLVGKVVNPWDEFKFDYDSNGEFWTAYPLIAPSEFAFQVRYSKLVEFQNKQKDMWPNTTIQSLTLLCNNKQWQKLPLSGNAENMQELVDNDLIPFDGRCLYWQEWTYSYWLEIVYKNNRNNEVKKKTLTFGTALEFKSEVSIYLTTTKTSSSSNKTVKILPTNWEFLLWQAPSRLTIDSTEIFRDFWLEEYHVIWDMDEDYDTDRTDQVNFNYSYLVPKVYYPSYKFPDLSDFIYTFPVRVEQSDRPVCYIKLSKYEWTTKFNIFSDFIDPADATKISSYNYTIKNVWSKKVYKTLKNQPQEIIFQFPEQWSYSVILDYVTVDGRQWQCESDIVYMEKETFDIQYALLAKNADTWKFKELCNSKSTDYNWCKQVKLSTVPQSYQLQIKSVSPSSNTLKRVVSLNGTSLLNENNTYTFEIPEEWVYDLVVTVSDPGKWMSEEYRNIRFTAKKDDIVGIMTITSSEKDPNERKIVTEWFEPLTVIIDASKTEVNIEWDEIIYFTWDFGDGEVKKNLQNWVVAHTYNYDYARENWIFQPVVKIKTRTWIEKTIYWPKLNVKKWLINIDISSTSHPSKQAQVWKDVSFSAEFDWLPEKMIWDFGDGSDPITCRWRTCTEVSHTFEETGLFSIKLSLEFDAVQQVDGTMDFKVY